MTGGAGPRVREKTPRTPNASPSGLDMGAGLALGTKVAFFITGLTTFGPEAFEPGVGATKAFEAKIAGLLAFGLWPKLPRTRRGCAGDASCCIFECLR